MNPRTAASALLDRAVGWRQGVIAQAYPVPRTLADVEVSGWAAVPEPFTKGSTSGGAGLDPESARLAALAEALERHAAARCPLETIDGAEVPAGQQFWPLDSWTLHSSAQRSAPDFPHRPGYTEPRYTQAWTFRDNEPVWVPAGLVGMNPQYRLPATSSGLAAESAPVRALLRGLQELVERDAFAVSWLHGVAARQVATPVELGEQVWPLGGRITVFDLTPAYSPHPVAAVAGTLPLAGRPRPTLGLACRASWAEAVAKAWLEWTQGTVFVAVSQAKGSPPLASAEVTDFDRHALYYADHPDQWRALPWWFGDQVPPPPDSPHSGAGAAAELGELVRALDSAGVRMAYRELTTPELAAVGLRAVRVLAPDLTPLHSDHRWPHLGGRTPDLAWRYPWATATSFPSAHPHPLG